MSHIQMYYVNQNESTYYSIIHFSMYSSSLGQLLKSTPRYGTTITVTSKCVEENVNLCFYTRAIMKPRDCFLLLQWI